MHYLEGQIDTSLGKILEYLVPQHSYKSVHDFFNPKLFQTALLTILHNIPDLTPHIDSLTSSAAILQGEGTGSSPGFIQTRIRNFSALWKTMDDAFCFQGMESRQVTKEELFRMVKEFDLDVLESFLDHLFELLIKHRGAVQYITHLPGENQAAIKDFLQRGKDKAEFFNTGVAVKQEQDEERQKLEEQNLELRHLLNSRDNDLQRVTLEKLQLEDQITELKELQTLKEAQIDSLKRRLLSYEQTDTLFHQKDQEIHKLNKTLNQLQLNNRLLTSDLSSEKNKVETKIQELEQVNMEISMRLEKVSQTLDGVSRQKEEIEQSNKKVINNLKQKIKTQSDKLGQVQSQLVQARISRQLRERQFSELWSNYESLRSQSLNDSSARTIPEKSSFSTNEMEPNLIRSSSQHREFLRLGEEINELDKLQENAFEEEIMMFESSEDNLKKVQEIIGENTRLKQRIGTLECKDYRMVSQENQKLKKKLAVMKRRNDQIETQRKEEIELMVSAFEACLRNKNSQLS